MLRINESRLKSCIFVEVGVLCEEGPINRMNLNYVAVYHTYFVRPTPAA